MTKYTDADRRACYAIDWDGYTPDIKLLKHYQSIIGVIIWTVSTLRFDVAYHISAVHDKTNREACKSAMKSYGLQSGYTSFQDLLQHTDIKLLKHYQSIIQVLIWTARR